MKYKLRDYQQEASDAAVRFFNDTRDSKNGLIIAPTGCHAKGTKLLMSDGSLKKVEDIQVGDRLLGVSGYRTVLSLHQGRENMYKLTPKKGKPFVVNEGHILHLHKSNDGRQNRQQFEVISVRDYLSKCKSFQRKHLLHRLPHADFDCEQHLPLNPYYLGLHLGDGFCGQGGIYITTQRKEVIDAMIWLAAEMHMRIRVRFKSNAANKAKDIKLLGFQGHVEKHRRYEKTRLRQIFEQLGLWDKHAGDKFIPQCYLTASAESRRELLAGLLDTDSYYDKRSNCYEYTTKSKQLADDIVFLCHSLGKYCGEPHKKIVNDAIYYRFNITGDMRDIPTRVGIRKGHERRQKKNHLVTGFSIECIGEGDYYGFTLDGDHLYCDEQFFVHHNCGKSLVIADIATRLQGNILVLQPSKEILQQNYDKYRSYDMENCSIYSASLRSKKISEVTFATIGSIMAHIDDFDHFKAIIVDECHGINSISGQYKTFIERVDRKVLGLTATPYRLNTSQGIVTPEGEYKPNGSFKDDDYFDVNGIPNKGVQMTNKCILKFLTRTRPRIFHKVLYEVSIQTLLQRGYLANVRYFDLPALDSSRIRRNSTGRDYDERSLFVEFQRSSLTDKLIDIVRRLLHPKSGIPRNGILVFTRFIEESEALVKAIDGCAMLTGDTPRKEREQIIDDFKTGKIKVLSNVGILTTGFDYPALDTVVMARPTMSLALFYQIVGRIVRPYEGKESWFVDLGENIKRFGKVEDLRMTQDRPGEYAIKGMVNGEEKQLTNVYY